jgi:hypothetical protein
MNVSPRSTISPLPLSVRLTLALWRALLPLCPRGFRDVYGADMTQVFRTQLLQAWRGAGALGVFVSWVDAARDLFIGALAARGDELGFTLDSLKRSWFMSRMRSSAITLFCAYILLVLTGMGFQKLTEDIMKSSLPITNPSVRLTYDAVVVAAVIALLAVIVGGVPLAWSSIRQAWATRRYGTLWLWTTPLIALIVWVGWTALLQTVIFPLSHNQGVQTTGGLWLARSWVGVLIVAAIVSVAGVAVAVTRSELDAKTYRFALRIAIAATLGMLLVLVGVAAFAVQVRSLAPGDLSPVATPLSPFGESIGFSLLVQVALLTLATVVAAVSVIRGLGTPLTPAESAPALA